MTLADHLQPWSGQALRHIPATSPLDVLDPRYAGRGTDNRWNDPGDPTLYLAGDEGVLIAEWGRHFSTNRVPQLRNMTVERRVYRLTLSIAAVIDLRLPSCWRAISLDDAPHCFLDVGVARSTANFIRQTTPARGLLVPSVSFLDQLDRWSLVLFLEKLPPPEQFASSVAVDGPLRWGSG